MPEDHYLAKIRLDFNTKWIYKIYIYLQEQAPITANHLSQCSPFLGITTKLIHILKKVYSINVAKYLFTAHITKA